MATFVKERICESNDCTKINTKETLFPEECNGVGCALNITLTRASVTVLNINGK